MLKTTLFYKGAQINKIEFSEIEDALNEFGFDAFELWKLMADDNDYVYVSNGFLSGLRNEIETHEWHHYFIKNGSEFQAEKLNFDINKN